MERAERAFPRNLSLSLSYKSIPPSPFSFTPSSAPLSLAQPNQTMGAEPDPEPSSTPTLSFLPLPNQSPEPAGMATPPLRPPASIPFLWEEAPGKPRTSLPNLTPLVRRLDLPPNRFLCINSVMDQNDPSPTSVLQGPYMGNSSTKSKGTGPSNSGRHGDFFGFWGRRVWPNKGGSLRLSESFRLSGDGKRMDGWDSASVTEGAVRITRVVRKDSFLSLSKTSGLLRSILKQMVPLRKRKHKKEGL
ncbi:uncharacterized protein LOC18442308 [Amborella trichopoda]|nr:uncharacterized protein LOC18442308 [Amborella trichopoda]|eukprot:XP_006852593.2 uncharacterized protein LOC18442308 [Amborella trichopoda]